MNDTIASYLDQYLKMPQTDFAVFLNGAWGSGKTFFVNQYLAARYGKSKDCAKDKKFWRVSLNGLSTEESVGLHLLGNLLPHGNSLPAIIGARLSNGLLKRFFDCDLTTMFKGNEVSRYLSGKGVKQELIILDDFERSVLSPERVLAFISSLVEKGSKVVIIGAGKEIRGDVEQNTPYCRIREKVVGKTFDIECDLEQVFQDLVGKDVFPNAEKPLLAAQGVLITLIKKYDAGVQQSNLRALKHAFRDFDYFIGGLEERFSRGEEFLCDLAKVFIPLDYAKQRGDWTYGDFERATEPRREGETASKFEQIMHRFGFNGFWLGNGNQEFIFSDRLWREVLWNRPVPPDEISGELVYSKYFAVKQDEPDWLTLWRWHQLEDLDAQKIVARVLKGVEMGQYKSPGEVLHVFCCLIGLAKEGVSNLTVDGVSSKFSSYLAHLVDSGELHEDNDFYPGYYNEGWMGHMFWRTEGTTAWKDLIAEMQNTLRDQMVKRRKAEVKSLCDSLAIDPNAFIEGIKRSPNDTSPILQNVSAFDFFKGFLSLCNYYKRKLPWELTYRWQQTSDELALQERSFIDGLADCCEKHLNQHSKDVYSPTKANVELLLDEMRKAQRIAEGAFNRLYGEYPEEVQQQFRARQT